MGASRVRALGALTAGTRATASSATTAIGVDLLAELDSDRTDGQGCEYAVLVSMLEEDSDLYTGITDVSHRYRRMFVIRPQFFLTPIGVLRNAALDTVAADRRHPVAGHHPPPHRRGRPTPAAARVEG